MLRREPAACCVPAKIALDHERNVGTPGLTDETIVEIRSASTGKLGARSVAASWSIRLEIRFDTSGFSFQHSDFK